MKKRHIKKLIENEVMHAEVRTHYNLNLILNSIVTRIEALEKQPRQLQCTNCNSFPQVKDGLCVHCSRHIGKLSTAEAKKAEWFGKVEEAIVDLNGMVQK